MGTRIRAASARMESRGCSRIDLSKQRSSPSIRRSWRCFCGVAARIHPEGSDDKTGDSPVVLAVEYWSPKILQLLLQPKFGLRTSGVACQRPTVEAMSVNRAEALEMLLDYYTAPLSESRFLLAKGLREACRSGRIDFVPLLLDNGADVNEAPNYTRNLQQPRRLAYAGWKGQVVVMCLLLAREASLGEHANRSIDVPSGGQTMRAVAWGGHYDATEVIDTSLRLGIRDWTGVMFLLSCRPNAAKLGRTILDDGHLRLSLLLVSDDDDSPVLAYLVLLACRHGNFEYLKALFDRGAPLNDNAVYLRRRYPPPIVMAMCWHQDTLVESLTKLEHMRLIHCKELLGIASSKGTFLATPLLLHAIGVFLLR